MATYKFDPDIFGDSEQFDISALYIVGLNETVPADAHTARRLLAKRALTEPATTITDTLSGHRVYDVELEESVTFTDQLAATSFFERIISETVTVEDAVIRTYTATRNLIEPGHPIFDADIFGDSEQFDVEGQAIHFADMVTAQRAIQKILSEDVEFTDQLAATSFFQRNIMEPVTNFADAVQRVFMAKRTVTENTDLDDTATASLTAKRTMEEDVVFSDTVAATSLFKRGLAEVLIWTDQAARRLLANRTLSEVITIDDDVEGFRARFIHIMEPAIIFSDTVQVTLYNIIINLVSYIAESLGLTTYIKTSIEKDTYIKDDETL